MARRTRPEAGHFLRITHMWGHDLPAPVWGVVVKRYGQQGDEALDLDVEVFLGVDLVRHILGHRLRGVVPIDEEDGFTVYRDTTLPHYALTAWTKYNLLNEGGLSDG